MTDTQYIAEDLKKLPDGGYEKIHISQNGSVREVFSKDDIHTETKIYNENKRLEKVERFNPDGQLDGNTEIYYPNGGIKIIMPYKDGIAHGSARFFDEQGQLKSTSYCVEGQSVSKEYALAYKKLHTDFDQAPQPPKKNFLNAVLATFTQATK